MPWLFALALAGELMDINKADAAALESLPGIGESTAANIIAYRDQNGPFTSIDQLDAVSGIGEKTMEKLRPLVTVSEGAGAKSGDDGATVTAGSAAASEAAATATTAAGCPVNINTASAAGLDVLPGIGDAKAAEIIAYREANGAFASCDGLDAVSGIGPATVDKLRACCVVK
ncbi:MAG: helix-hairpin-helix domain-containing protein [Deltaproteobacteria bacterium]|nr:helix-hairpin-helix domain-containing protein [Deltaproteobacteria bacterium]